MKRRTHAVAAVLIVSGLGASSGAFADSATTAGPATPVTASASPVLAPEDARHRRDFDRFLERYEAANSAFVNGDPSLWMPLATETDPASIFGGFGGPGNVGAPGVNQRYLFAATVFRPSGADVEFEYLVKDVQGRFAYTVAIERADVLYAGHATTEPQVLRVTMVFRFERGDWKIVHRHADTMVELELPTP